MAFWHNSIGTADLVLVIVAVLIGLVVGAEREYQNKSAGLRTFILISFGACIFTLMSLKIGAQSSSPDRIAANIITGIGFIGAGVIFKDDNKISGVTTAATIWAVASLGVSVGAGYVAFALFGTLLVLVILRSLFILQQWIDSRHKIRSYRIVTANEVDFDYCQTLFHSTGLRALLLAEQYRQGQLTTTWQLIGSSVRHEALIRHLRNNPRIVSYQF